MAYISVPKDLDKIKSKVVGGLTAKQIGIITLGSAIAIPAFWGMLTTTSVGPAMVALCSIVL